MIRALALIAILWLPSANAFPLEDVTRSYLGRHMSEIIALNGKPSFIDGNIYTYRIQAKQVWRYKSFLLPWKQYCEISFKTSSQGIVEKAELAGHRDLCSRL